VINAASGCHHAPNIISFTWRLPSLPPGSAGAPLENLLPVVVEVGSEEACSQFVEDLLGMHGRIDHAVSCFGSQWQRGEWQAGGRLAAYPLAHACFGRRAGACSCQGRLT
jgi:hypothetical protein